MKFLKDLWLKSFVVFLSVLGITSLAMIQGCGYSANDKLVKPNKAKNSALRKEDKKKDRVNVVSPDWGNAATLTAMGYPPIATGDIRVWEQWVGKPELPSSVTDLGIRYQPNAELVAQLPVDMVIDNYFYQHARGLYGDVPAESVIFASENETSTWQDYVSPTQKLGQLINQPQAAEDYIQKSRQHIQQSANILHKRYPEVETFAVVQFVDANNMRMYAKNSLFNVIFKEMSFDFVALKEGNSWGFAPIQLGDLAKLDDSTCLLVIEPLSPITENELQNSLIWQRLGYGRVINESSENNVEKNSAMSNSRCMAKLKPVWIYGGTASLTVLADNLISAKLKGGAAQ